MDTTDLKARMNTKVQALSEREPGTSQYLALNSNALELIQENLKHQPLSFHLFDMVKSPSGGSTVFSVPGLSGEEAEKELTGIILDYMTPRAYWATSDPVEGMPPTCLSKDSLISADGKVCAHCPCNDFGSKDGESNAKACKESVLLFLLRPGSVFPLLAPGASDQQEAVLEIHHPPGEPIDASQQCSDQGHLGKGHQPGRGNPMLCSILTRLRFWVRRRRKRSGSLAGSLWISSMPLTWSLCSRKRTKLKRRIPCRIFTKLSPTEKRCPVQTPQLPGGQGGGDHRQAGAFYPERGSSKAGKPRSNP